MSDDNVKKFDNSWEAVWQREINELEEKLKRSEYYSASEVEFMKSRKKQLEEAIAKRNQPKKNLADGFAKGQQNVKDQAAMKEAQMAQFMGGQGME